MLDEHLDAPTTQAVEQVVNRMDPEAPERYRVGWSCGKLASGASCAVRAIRVVETGRTVLALIDAGGREYRIDSNPGGDPQVVKKRPNGYDTEGRLAELTVVDEGFDWRYKILRMAHKASGSVPDVS